MTKFSSNLAIKSFVNINDKMKQLLNQESQSNCESSPRNDTTQNNANDNILFPLLRLPIDLITKTSFFLNENDIFQFQQCCRLFYKMINNTSYLHKSNNFKTFQITDKRLDQMAQSKYNFFKYSK